jgi:hypothetical protein
MDAIEEIKLDILEKLERDWLTLEEAQEILPLKDLEEGVDRGVIWWISDGTTEEMKVLKTSILRWKNRVIQPTAFMVYYGQPSTGVSR